MRQCKTELSIIFILLFFWEAEFLFINTVSAETNLPSDTTPPNEATNLQSITHTPSSWSSNNTIKVTWTDAIDNEGGSGLDGYSVLWDTSPDTLPPINKNLEEGIETYTNTLSDGNNHYFHIRAVDNVGNWDDIAIHLGPFYIDTQGPSVPSLLSPSNQTTTSDISPTFSWNISTDGEGSGVKSYRIYIDDKSTFPSPRVREYTTPNLNYTPNLYGKDLSNPIYWKVYAKDNVDNKSDWSEIWEFIINSDLPGLQDTSPQQNIIYLINDTTPPSTVTNLQSPNHNINIWSKNNLIDVSWTTAEDNLGGSGLDGYSILWDNLPDTLPDTTKDLEQDVVMTTSPPLNDGNNHYFHIRTVDNANNWNDNANHLGPFYIDTQGPTAPTLTSPSNNAIINDTSPTFIWNAATDNNGSGLKSYRIYIDDEAGFVNPRIKEFTTTNLKYTPTLYAGDFYWKVYAKDNADNISTWSNIWKLKIDPTTTNINNLPTYPRHIWINEFLPNPAGRDTENEFIEIYNKGPDEIDLNGWQIDDCENKGSHPHKFPAGKIIKAGEYLSLPYSDTKIALNNDHDCVRLLWPDDTAIDEIEYENPPEAESYNKKGQGWCWSTTPTPGEQNNCSGKKPEKEEIKEYSRALWINEFLPDPKGKDEEGEFIELQNRGEEEIDLTDWQIDDCENTGSRPHTFSENTKIQPDHYLTLYYKDTKISLNNNGDCVRLLNPAGQAVDEIKYGKAKEGQSYSRQNVDHWQWTDNPTPYKDNEFKQILAAKAEGPKTPKNQVQPNQQKILPPHQNLRCGGLPQTGPDIYIYFSPIFLFFFIPRTSPPKADGFRRWQAGHGCKPMELHFYLTKFKKYYKNRGCSFKSNLLEP